MEVCMCVYLYVGLGVTEYNVWVFTYYRGWEFVEVCVIFVGIDIRTYRDLGWEILNIVKV